MQRLRFKITKKRTKNYHLLTENLTQKISQTFREKVYAILDNDVLPLVIAPAMFIVFVGLEWWHWYTGLPTPSPILLTFIALGLGVYCFFKLFGYKKVDDRQITVGSDIDQHPELH